MNLEKIRHEIDDIDSQIIGLLSERGKLVTAAGTLKQNEQGVRDQKRVEQVIERVRVRAAESGLDPGIAAEIYRTIINCFIGKELKEYITASPGEAGVTATEFPKFMKHPANAVAGHQKSDGVEGYVFDGVDGSQLGYSSAQKTAYQRNTFMTLMNILLSSGENINWELKAGEQR